MTHWLLGERQPWMSSLKLRFPSTPLLLISNARLPALIALALAGAVILQLAMPNEVILPDSSKPGRAALQMSPPSTARAVAIPAALGNPGLFAATAIGKSSDTAADLLNGAVIAGTLQRGRSRVAVVQMPQGTIRYVAPGGSIADWRIVALLPGSVRLERGAEYLVLNYGQHAASQATQPDNTNKDN
jgi:hypothetical protein